MNSHSSSISPEPAAPILPESEALRQARDAAESGARAPEPPPEALPIAPPVGAAAPPVPGDFVLEVGENAPAYVPSTWTPPAAAPPQPKPGFLDRLRKMGPAGAAVAVALGKLKILLPVLKFLLPALKTGGSMLIYVLFFAQRYGMVFAVGVVLCILVHELGHVFAAWRLGIPVSAPIFIPFFGALILQKKWARSLWEEALIGIGGPLGGMLAGVVCLFLYQQTRMELFLGVAYFTFLLNLFNMLPLFPMDGGRIIGAVSPRFWLLGLIAMAAGYLTGYITNPLLLILILISLPSVWRGLKTGDLTPPGGVPVTPLQRVIMGGAYMGVSGLLVWLMALCHQPGI